MIDSRVQLHNGFTHIASGSPAFRIAGQLHRINVGGSLLKIRQAQKLHHGRWHCWDCHGLWFQWLFDEFDGRRFDGGGRQTLAL